MVSEKCLTSSVLLRGARVAVKLKSYQGNQKNCAVEFLILSFLKLPSYDLVVFINMNPYIPKEGTNFGAVALS